MLGATRQKLGDVHALLAINSGRLSPEELHRRHEPVTSLFVPLIERGQAEGVFRRDLPVAWHLAMVRAIAHAASAEVEAGPVAVADVEPALLSTVLHALAPR